MAKGMYIGAGGVARKVKKVYVGAGGVARKVKKAYLGVGGVARCVFGGEGVEYYGSAAPLSKGRSYLAAASVGKHALFAGGQASFVTNVVDAYDEQLTRKDAPTLYSPKRKLAATSVGKYALFAGGYDGSTYPLTVDAYNDALTYTRATDMIAGTYDLAATTVGDYALFAGGQATAVSGRATAYSSSLTRSQPDGIGYTAFGLAAANVNGIYAIFAGGRSGNEEVLYGSVYDRSLTRRMLASGLSEKKSYLAAASVGKYALFAGGVCQGAYCASVDAFDESLTRLSAPALSTGKLSLSAASVGGHALFVGGYVINSSSKEPVVDVYDKSLTHRIISFPEHRSNLAAAAAGDHVLVAGGVISGGNVVDTVDVYRCA